MHDKPVSVFISIGSAPNKHELRNIIRKTWAKDCKRLEGCAYKFFTDDVATKDEDEEDLMKLKSAPGYAHFGDRAVQRMLFSLANIEFDHYLRIDDDGLICVEHLLADLQRLPKQRLFWGKYWCQKNLPRMDENFMLMSRDVLKVLARGWKTGKLPFRGEMSLDKLAANLQPMMNLDIVGDARRLRWLGPVLVADPSMRASDGNDQCLAHYKKRDVTNATQRDEIWKELREKPWGKCPGICHRFVWVHHLSPDEITRLWEGQKNVPFKLEKALAPPPPKIRKEKPTQCHQWQGFPKFNSPYSGKFKRKRRQRMQNASCFWIWCEEDFGGHCCNATNVDRVTNVIETLFAEPE